ncbi:hypothetical protein [Arhodomonas sp. SL1]|uniref:hypothetical protein n=1 Tax=Arhodomonas sp. SL1 TaxID=3425691 RepID=UPI003F881C82
MLIQLLLVAAVATGAVLWVSPAARATLRERLPRILVIGAVIVAVALVVTGRAHWITAAVAGLVALAQRLAPLLLNAGWVARLLRQWRGGNTAGAGADAGAGPTGTSTGETPPEGPMTRARALEILGLSGEPERADILAAHRRLMQRCHPDRGGSSYLAARLNEARDCLLGERRA